MSAVERLLDKSSAIVRARHSVAQLEWKAGMGHFSGKITGEASVRDHKWYIAK